ncbi:DUF7667 family protein [Paenibacillus pseudetheri]|uniref:Uncharacterized protein n=1 Tax=Paenibacillus pseudetheri TaxID=2897682 RepID=A0ABM9BJQ2_9BACL|nr:hypothetical protein [Paenibacillus pseudetheri]CAH1058818.1 hypothetical protein PAECIP111894_05004 [Paenibacillus pseudetheri]
MIAIHPAHRKLADLYHQFEKGTFTRIQQAEVVSFLKQNAEMVEQIDGLKEAAYAAQCIGNMDLVQHFTEKLEELEVQLT